MLGMGLDQFEGAGHGRRITSVRPCSPLETLRRYGLEFGRRPNVCVTNIQVVRTVDTLFLPLQGTTIVVVVPVLERRGGGV